MSPGLPIDDETWQSEYWLGVRPGMEAIKRLGVGRVGGKSGVIIHRGVLIVLSEPQPMTLHFRSMDIWQI